MERVAEEYAIVFSEHGCGGPTYVKRSDLARTSEAGQTSEAEMTKRGEELKD